MTTSLLGHFSAGIIIFYKLLWLVRTDQGYVQSANFYKGIEDLISDIFDFKELNYLLMCTSSFWLRQELMAW